jgi:wyosine [tRNA(Phe)-imidazoG37] synthetase (radical SAM superfamily)
MLLKDINDSEPYINEFSKILSKLEFDELFLNTVVRPPLDDNKCKPLSSAELKKIAKFLQPLGVPIELANPATMQKRRMFPDRT